MIETQENYYIKGGKKYVRVTHVISTVLRQAWLETWRGDVGNEMADKKRDEAAESGIRIHRAIATFDSSGLRSGEECEKVIAYWKWHEMVVEETIATEETVFSEKYGYAGTLDKRVILRGEELPTIVDIKSGSHNEHYCRMQTVAYLYGDGIELTNRRLVVNLKTLTKDGLPKIYSFDRHQEDFTAFIMCLNVYNWLQT